MRNHQWTAKDDEYIKASCQTLSRTQIAKHFKVSLDAISTHMSKIGVRKFEAWTPADAAYILRHYKRDTCVELAEFFGCTPNTMRTRLHDLGLKRFEHLEGQPCPPPAMDLM